MKTLLAELAGARAAEAALAAPAFRPRIVVLGFDGVDSQIVEQMLAAGRLPNLAALKARGGYSPLLPTVPAQTPVSWTTFSTGLDPGGHEIFDFLKRDPSNRIPTFAVAEEIEKPFLAGRWNAAAAGAVVLLAFVLASAPLFRRRVSWFWRLLVVVVGVVFAMAASLPARASLPEKRPAVKNTR